MDFNKKRQMVKDFIITLATGSEVLVENTVDEKDLYNIYITTSLGVAQIFLTDKSDFTPYKHMFIGVGKVDYEEIKYWYDDDNVDETDLQNQLEFIKQELL